MNKIRVNDKVLDINFNKESNKVELSKGDKNSWMDFRDLVEKNPFRSLDVVLTAEVFIVDDSSDFLFSNLNSISLDHDIKGNTWSCNNFFAGTKAIKGSFSKLKFRVNSVYLMFAFVEELPKDIGEFNLKNVRDIEGMFKNCRAEIDESIENWDISQYKSLKSLFSCAKHIPKAIAKWDVSGVEDISYMFEFTNNIPKEIADMNFRYLKNMDYTFYNCKNLPAKSPSWVTVEVESAKFCCSNTGEDVADLLKGLDFTDKCSLVGFIGGSYLSNPKVLRHIYCYEPSKCAEVMTGYLQDNKEDLEDEICKELKVSQIKEYNGFLKKSNNFFSMNRKKFDVDKMLNKTLSQVKSDGDYKEYLSAEFFNDCLSNQTEKVIDSLSFTFD